MPLITLSQSARSTAAFLLAVCDPLTEHASPFASKTATDTISGDGINDNNNENNNNILNKNESTAAAADNDVQLLKVHENLSYTRYGINPQQIPDASCAHYAWNMLLKYATLVGDKSIEKYNNIMNNTEKRKEMAAEGRTEEGDAGHHDEGDHDRSLSPRELENFLLFRSSCSRTANDRSSVMNTEELDIYELFGFASVGTTEKENFVKLSGQRRERTTTASTTTTNVNNKTEQTKDGKSLSSSNDDDSHLLLPILSDDHRNFALVIQQLSLCVACIIVGYKSRGTLQHIYPVSRAIFPRVLRILLALFHSHRDEESRGEEERKDTFLDAAETRRRDKIQQHPHTSLFLSLSSRTSDSPLSPTKMEDTDRHHQQNPLTKFSFPHQLSIARYFDRSIIVYELILTQFLSSQSCQLTPLPLAMLRTSLVDVLVGLNRLSSYPPTMMSAAIAKQFGIVSYEFTRVDYLNPVMIHFVDPKTGNDDDDDEDDLVADNNNNRNNNNEITNRPAVMNVERRSSMKTNYNSNDDNDSASRLLLPDLNLLTTTVTPSTTIAETTTSSLPSLIVTQHTHQQQQQQHQQQFLPHQVAESQQQQQQNIHNITNNDENGNDDDDDWFDSGNDVPPPPPPPVVAHDQYNNNDPNQKVVAARFFQPPASAYACPVVHFTMPRVQHPSEMTTIVQPQQQQQQQQQQHQPQQLTQEPAVKPKSFFITDMVLPEASSSLLSSTTSISILSKNNNNNININNNNKPLSSSSSSLPFLPLSVRSNLHTSDVNDDDLNLTISAVDLMFKTDEEKRLEIARRRELLRRKEVCGSKRVDHMLRIIRKIYNEDEEAHALKLVNEDKKKKFDEMMMMTVKTNHKNGENIAQNSTDNNHQQRTATSTKTLTPSILSMQIEGLPSLFGDESLLNNDNNKNADEEKYQQKQHTTTITEATTNPTTIATFVEETTSTDLNEAHQTIARWTQNAMRLLSPWSDIARRLSVHDVSNHYNSLHLKKLRETKNVLPQQQQQQQEQEQHENQQEHRDSFSSSFSSPSSLSTSAPELRYLNRFMGPHAMMKTATSSSQMRKLLNVASENVQVWMNRWNQLDMNNKGSDNRRHRRDDDFFSVTFNSVITRLCLLAAIVCDFVVTKKCDVIPSLLMNYNKNIHDYGLQQQQQLDEINDKMPNYQVVFEALTFFSSSSTSTSYSNSNKSSDQNINSSSSTNNHHQQQRQINFLQHQHQHQQQQRRLKQEHDILRDYFGVETSSQLRQVIYQLARELILVNKIDAQRERNKVKNFEEESSQRNRTAATTTTTTTIVRGYDQIHQQEQQQHQQDVGQIAQNQTYNDHYSTSEAINHEQHLHQDAAVLDDRQQQHEPSDFFDDMLHQERQQQLNTDEVNQEAAVLFEDVFFGGVI